MFQKSYLDYIKEEPESEFSKFLIKFFNTKPDLEEMGREVREFDHQLAMEQKEEVRQRIAAKFFSYEKSPGIINT